MCFWFLWCVVVYTHFSFVYTMVNCFLQNLDHVMVDDIFYLLVACDALYIVRECIHVVTLCNFKVICTCTTAVHRYTPLFPAEFESSHWRRCGHTWCVVFNVNDVSRYSTTAWSMYSALCRRFTLLLDVITKHSYRLDTHRKLHFIKPIIQLLWI